VLLYPFAIIVAPCVGVWALLLRRSGMAGAGGRLFVRWNSLSVVNGIVSLALGVLLWRANELGE
jgi:hypothetical protein